MKSKSSLPVLTVAFALCLTALIGFTQAAFGQVQPKTSTATTTASSKVASAQGQQKTASSASSNGGVRMLKLLKPFDMRGSLRIFTVTGRIHDGEIITAYKKYAILMDDFGKQLSDDLDEKSVTTECALTGHMGQDMVLSFGNSYGVSANVQKVVNIPEVKVVSYSKTSKGGTLITVEDIFIAVEAGDLSMVKKLLRDNPDMVSRLHVDPNDENIGSSLLNEAILTGNNRMIELLIANKADVNAPDKTGPTPLQEATEMREMGAMELLLAHNADVNGRNAEGSTALQYLGSTSDGDIPEAKLLLAHGANVNNRDNEGNTPLHRAAEIGSKELTELLLEHGPEVNSTNNAGITPLQIALVKEYKDVAELLRQHGGK